MTRHLKIVIVSVLPWYKSNKTLHNMQLLENNQRQDCRSNSASCPAASDYRVDFYFPITAWLRSVLFLT